MECSVLEEFCFQPIQEYNFYRPNTDVISWLVNVQKDEEKYNEFNSMLNRIRLYRITDNFYHAYT